MDKYYSKKAKIVKSVYCFLLIPICLLFDTALNIDDNVVSIMLPVVIAGCLYTVPFWLSAAYMKKYRVTGSKKYISADALCCLVPSFFGALVTDFVMALIEKSDYSGITTIIFAVIFIIIFLVFSLAYALLCKNK